MSNKLNFEKEIEFIQQLRSGKITTPNIFTIEMGRLIKGARENKGISQAKLAEIINRRPATISEIENGKSEIGIFTLLALSIELEKPISYFFPESIVKKYALDVITPYEYEVLELIKGIEYFDDQNLTLEILKLLHNYYENRFRVDSSNQSI